MKTASEELDDLLLLKVDLLEFVISKGFHVGEYLKQKAVLSIDDTASTKGKGEKRSGNSTERKNEKAEPKKVEIPLHGKNGSSGSSFGYPASRIIQASGSMA